MNDTTSLPPELAARYSVLDVLGRGGQGLVVLVADRTSGARVVLKLLLEADDRGIRRFEREARLLASIDHPHIVSLLDYGRVGDRPYLVLPHLTGCSLGSWIQEGARPPDEVARLLHQIGRALAYVHEKGILHRDIKPDNIFVSEDREAAFQLIDFGLGHEVRDERLTETGVFYGSLSYAAPEKFHDDGLDPRSDLYSLGVTALEMATGANPFKGESVNEVWQKHKGLVLRRIDELHGTHPALEEILLDLLRKNRDERVPSAALLVERLEAEVLASAPTAAAEDAPIDGTRVLSRGTSALGDKNHAKPAAQDLLPLPKPVPPSLVPPAAAGAPWILTALCAGAALLLLAGRAMNRESPPVWSRDPGGAVHLELPASLPVPASLQILDPTEGELRVMRVTEPVTMPVRVEDLVPGSIYLVRILDDAGRLSAPELTLRLPPAPRVHLHMLERSREELFVDLSLEPSGTGPRPFELMVEVAGREPILVPAEAGSLSMHRVVSGLGTAAPCWITVRAAGSTDWVALDRARLDPGAALEKTALLRWHGELDRCRQATALDPDSIAGGSPGTERVERLAALLALRPGVTRCEAIGGLLAADPGAEAALGPMLATDPAQAAMLVERWSADTDPGASGTRTLAMMGRAWRSSPGDLQLLRDRARHDPSPGTRATAWRCLALSGSRELARLLAVELAVTDVTSSVLWAAALTRERTLAPKVADILRRPDLPPAVASAALTALGFLGEPAVLPLVREKLARAVAPQDWIAAWVAGQLRDPDARPLLLDRLGADDAMAPVAAWALGRIGGGAAIQALTQALEANGRGTAPRSPVATRLLERALEQATASSSSSAPAAPAEEIVPLFPFLACAPVDRVARPGRPVRLQVVAAREENQVLALAGPVPRRIPRKDRLDTAMTDLAFSAWIPATSATSRAFPVFLTWRLPPDLTLSADPILVSVAP